MTGASRGVGAGVARELARENMRIALVARDAELLTQVAHDLQQRFNSDVLTIACDLRERETAASVVERAMSYFGQLDLVANNAGATKRGDFSSLTDDDWQDGLELKLHGYVRMTRAAWSHLARREGAIVNVVVRTAMLERRQGYMASRLFIVADRRMPCISMLTITLHGIHI